MALLQRPSTFYERAQQFRLEAEAFIKSNKVSQRRTATDIEAKRIALVCAEIIVKLYGARFGQDAEAEFYEWARKQRLTCLPLLRETRKARGKRAAEWVANIFPASYWKAYPRITFRAYFPLFMNLLEPERTPITCRTPVREIPK